MIHLQFSVVQINDLNMCWELCSYLVEENYGPSWKCCWALINKNTLYINELILSFISLHCDEILLDDVLKKSSFIRDESIPKVLFFFWILIIEYFCRKNIRSHRLIHFIQIHSMIEIIHNRLFSSFFLFVFLPKIFRWNSKKFLS